jgi:hypothetical protein
MMSLIHGIFRLVPGPVWHPMRGHQPSLADGDPYMPKRSPHNRYSIAPQELPAKVIGMYPSLTIHSFIHRLQIFDAHSTIMLDHCTANLSEAQDHYFPSRPLP